MPLNKLVPPATQSSKTTECIRRKVLECWLFLLRIEELERQLKPSQWKGFEIPFYNAGFQQKEH